MGDRWLRPAGPVPLDLDLGLDLICPMGLSPNKFLKNFTFHVHKMEVRVMYIVEG